jgi:hypothetical protein
MADWPGRWLAFANCWVCSNDRRNQSPAAGILVRRTVPLVSHWEGRQVKTPAATKVTTSARNTRKFTGTENPRHLRAIAALMSRPISREELDSIAGCSNGPELVAELRRRGLDKDDCLPCERIKFIDRDGNICRPGVYSLTEKGRRLIYAWMAQRKRQNAAAPGKQKAVTT